MAVDLQLSPWNRLAKLAPPDTDAQDLQEAADRWALNADVYNAAADLWEDKAAHIDLGPDTIDPDAVRVVNKVTQDGVSVEYASDHLAGNSQSTRTAQQAQMMAMVRRLRARGKPTSPLVHDPEYNPWRNNWPADDEQVIVIE